MKDLKFPKIEDEYDQKLISDINETGFHIIGIEKDNEGPEYAFTVGLYYTYNHPEILIMGIKHEVCIEFFHLIVNKIKNGSKFIDGVVDRELSSYPYNAFYFNERKANIYMAFGCQGKNHLNRSENRQ